MRLLSFRARSFKNLRDVTMSEFGDVNFIHGDNGVGKSNVLEAIRAFAALGALPFDSSSAAAPLVMGDAFGKEWKSGSAPKEPVALEAEYVDDAGNARVVGFRCSRGRAYLTRTRDESGADLVQDDETVAVGDRAAVDLILRELGTSLSVGQIPEARLDPNALGQHLFGAFDALEAPGKKPWKEFQTQLEPFADLIQGTVRPRASRPPFVVDKGDFVIDLAAAGSGLSNLVRVVASTVLLRDPILTIDEPELSLRWSLQERLGRFFRELAVARPCQIFATSHSPAFETSKSVRHFHMTAGPDGPTITGPLAKDRVREATGVPPERPPLAPDGESYVSSEGVLKLPPTALSRLELSSTGGTVVCIDGDERRRVVMMPIEDWEEMNE